MVERKGLGHPDTICDALAETFSRNLCRAYRQRFGQIMHHNVDKALLCAGRAAPALGGGKVLAPISIYLAGRATTQVGSDHVPIQDIAIEGSQAWLRSNLHALDSDRDVVMRALIEPGSLHLQAHIVLPVGSADHVHQLGHLATLIGLVAARDRMLDAVRDMVA